MIKLIAFTAYNDKLLSVMCLVVISLKLVSQVRSLRVLPTKLLL